MRWRFWEKKKSVALENLKYPADAHESVLVVAGLFLQNLFPFSDWQAPDAHLSAKGLDTARFCARGIQLAAYFWLFSNKFGHEAMRIARDCLALTLDSRSDVPIGTMTEALIVLIDEAYNSVDVGQKVMVKGKEVEIPLEYWVSLYVLLRMNYSPYYMQDDLSLDGNDWALASCLAHAKDKALPECQRMVDSVKEFNVASFHH